MNYFECCHHCVPPKRYPGCSGKCPEYAEARAKYDADKKKDSEKHSLDRYVCLKTMASNDGVAKYAKRRPKKYYF